MEEEVPEVTPEQVQEMVDNQCGYVQHHKSITYFCVWDKGHDLTKGHYMIDKMANAEFIPASKVE